MANFITMLLVYGRRLVKPNQTQTCSKPRFGGFPNSKLGFGKKAPGLQSLVSKTKPSGIRISIASNIDYDNVESLLSPSG